MCAMKATVLGTRPLTGDWGHGSHSPRDCISCWGPAGTQSLSEGKPTPTPRMQGRNRAVFPPKRRDTGSQLRVYKPLWLKSKKSLVRNRSESLDLGRPIHRGQQGVCNREGTQRAGRSWRVQGGNDPAGRSHAASCSPQTPEVSGTTCGRVSGAPRVSFSPHPRGPALGLGGPLCSESDHPISPSGKQNRSPLGAPQKRETPLSILPPKNPGRLPMWDLLSGHPQGTEQIRSRFPQTWPRMQGIRAGHPTNCQWSLLSSEEPKFPTPKLQSVLCGSPPHTPSPASPGPCLP